MGDADRRSGTPRRPRPLRTLVASSILAGLGAAAALPGPAAAASWSERAICRPCGKAPIVDLAVAPGGLTAVLWVARDRVEAAVRPPGGRFSAPERLGQGPGARGPVRGGVAVGADGTAAAAWEERLPGGVATRVIEVAVRPPGGSWGTPERVAVGVRPEVAVGPDGTAFVSLNAEVGSDRRVRLAVRPPGGSWALEEVGASTKALNLDPHLALAGDRVLVAWTEFDVREGRGQGLAAVREGGVWQAPQAMPSGGSSIALDDRGTAHTVWRANPPGGAGPRPVLASSRPPGGSWSAPAQVAADAAAGGLPEVAVDAAGNALAAWSGTGGGPGVSIARRDAATGTWEAPRAVAETAPREALALAVAASGRAVVAWETAGAAGRIAVLAARGSSLSGQVGSPEALSAPGAMAAPSPSVAAGVDREGRPTVAWVGAGPAVWVATPAAGAVRLTAAQIRINQRISQAAIRRLNALQARIDGTDPPAADGSGSAAVALTAAQLRINQRISQAAVFRANRLAAMLAGELEPATRPERRPNARVELSAAQLRINQRISQAAVRRADALEERVPELPPGPRPPGSGPVLVTQATALGAYRLRINAVGRGPVTPGTDVALVLPSHLQERPPGEGQQVFGEGTVVDGVFFPFILSIADRR